MDLSWDSAIMRYLRAAIIIIIVIFVLFIEPYNLQVTENSFDLFDGNNAIQVVFIADTQDAYHHPEYFERVIEAVNAREPDLILLGGDNVEIADEWNRTDQLGNLKSKYGIYAVLGNHDYISWDCKNCSDKVESKLESMGIKVLRNEYEILNISGREFALIGVDDLQAGRSNYRLASRDVPDNMSKIILAHNQYSVTRHDLEGKNLVLSGHTHCGLVQIPYVTDFILQSSNFADVIGGRATIDENSELYVTCGITPGGVRLFTRPEISVIYVN